MTVENSIDPNYVSPTQRIKKAFDYVVSHMLTLVIGVLLGAIVTSYIWNSTVQKIKNNSYEFCRTVNAEKSCIDCHKGENFLTLFKNPAIDNNPKLRKDILNQSGVR